MLDEGVLRLALRSAPPRLAFVRLKSEQAGLGVVNRLTNGAGSSGSASLGQRADDAGLIVRGEWAAACGDMEIALRALPHTEFARRAVAALWCECGGSLKGRVRSHAEPKRAHVPRHPDGNPLDARASLWSQPLPALIREINKTSASLLVRSQFGLLLP